MSKSIQSEDVRSFYNSTFFDEKGQVQSAQISMTIRQGEKMVIIPGIEAYPGTTLDQVFREFYTYLEKHGPLEERLKAEESKEPKVLDFAQIDYRGNTYLIEERPDEEYVVRRTSDNKVLNNQSPTVKGVVKAFREGRE